MTKIDLAGGQSIYVEESYGNVVSQINLGCGIPVELTEVIYDFSFESLFTPEKVVSRGRVFINPKLVAAVHGEQ